MARYIRQTPPAWFRIVGIVLLLWGLMGVYACVQQFRLGADAMGPASEYDRALFRDLPVWYNFVYALAVGGGFLGAIALLGRAASARPLFAMSLIAAIVQFGWIFAMTDLIAVKGAATVLPFPIFIIAVAVFQLWFAGYARRRGWIG